MSRYEECAKIINGALKGLGTKEEVIIKELVQYQNRDLQQIKKTYLACFGKTLEEDLSSDMSGNLLETFLALLVPSEDYDAICVRKAMKGAGTNEKTLIHTLCTKDANEIKELKTAYTRLFSRDLDQDILDDVGSGDLGRLLRSLATGGRADTKQVDLQMAKNEADELYKAGEGKFGTDSSVFIRILCTRSFLQLRATFEEYDKLSKIGFEKAVEKEMSGDMERACLAIVKTVRNRCSYFAEELHGTMKGLGTRDSHLIRLIVSRREIDLPKIKEAYQEIYKKSLYYDIEKDTSGHYRTLLHSLIA